MGVMIVEMRSGETKISPTVQVGKGLTEGFDKTWVTSDEEHKIRQAVKHIIRDIIIQKQNKLQYLVT